MATRNTTPGTTFESAKGWYQGRACRVYRQRVQPTHGSFITALGFNIPAKAAVLGCFLANNAVATITGTAAGATANSIALVMFPTSSPAVTAPLTAAPTTATVKGVSAAVSTLNGAFTNGCILAQTPGIGTSETNGVYRGAPIIRRVCTNPNGGAENMNPVEAFLAVVPALISSNTFAVNATDSTAAFLFGTSTTTSTNTAADLNAVLYVEVLEDTPSF